MINSTLNQYNSRLAAQVSGPITLNTATESLSARVAQLNEMAADLNLKLADIRGKLFSEAEANGAPDNPPPSCLDGLVFEASRRLNDAFAQASSILNRL